MAMHEIRCEVNAYRNMIDAQRMSLQTTEHSEQSIVSVLQEHSASHSGMAEQRDEHLQAPNGRTDNEAGNGGKMRSTEHRELKSAAIATTDLRVESYRLELVAEQSHALLMELESRQLATQL